MIRFLELYDAPTGTFNFYEYQGTAYQYARLFLIDINRSSKRAYCFVVYGDDIYYFWADIWEHESVEYLYWYNRYNDKIVEFQAIDRKSVAICNVSNY